MIHKLFFLFFYFKIKVFFIINIFYINQNCYKIHYTKNVHILLGKFFHRYKNMNSSFVAISTLIKSDIGEKCLLNFLINISTQALKDYLKSANIYIGNASKKEI